MTNDSVLKYELAVFDFDGTLADSLPRLLGIFNRLAERYRFQKITPADAQELRVLDMRQALKRLRIPLWRVPIISWQVRKLARAETADISLFPGIRELLPRLAERGVQLGMVSSNSWENIERVLGPQLAGLFRHVECNASIFGKRPKLRKVARKSGVSADRILYIGDELRDLHAARAERLPFGAVTWGYTPEKVFREHAPEEVFHTVTEMGAWLTGNTFSP